jgi:hypothetical protein
MTGPEENTLRPGDFRRLKWSLQGLATSGSDQRTLFPDCVAKPGDLALDFDHWASVMRGNYETELSASQTQSLAAIDRQLAIMSRDSAEFDLELWNEAAPRTSEYWADVRRLAASALEAFGWPIESPPQSPDDRATQTSGHPPEKDGP